VYYELVPGEAAGDLDRPGDASEPLVVRVHARQETSCANATAPTSLATVYASDPRLQQFVDKFRSSQKYSPEYGAECTGGAGTPLQR
jgi:hypothetical protein